MMVLVFQRVQGCWQQADVCGDQGAREKHGSGTALREMLHRHSLGCTGTYYNVGPTYFGHDSSSRIDWLFVPDGLLHAVRHQSVLQKLGRQIQKLNSAKHRDHCPVYHEISFAFPVGAERQVGTVWDRDRMMDMVMGKVNREGFLLTVEEHMSEIEDAVGHSLIMDKDTDAAWDLINGVIKTAASKHFGKGKHEEDVEISDFKKERKEVLQKTMATSQAH